jgi:hypothetical protein
MTWYLLAVSLLWLAGVEAIYGHPTPFYAVLRPVFSSYLEPMAMSIILGLLYLTIRPAFAPERQRTFYREWIIWSIWVLTFLVFLYRESSTLSQPFGHASMQLMRILTWHLLATVIFILFYVAGAYSLTHGNWFNKEPSNVFVCCFLLGAVAFSISFACGISMVRDGPVGIVSAFARQHYEVTGDIWAASSVYTLFNKYVEWQPFLSIHGRVHPPGPVLLMRAFSAVFGRSPSALSLATLSFGSLAILPLFAWTCALTNRRVALTSVMLYTVVPAIVLFTATSTDILFMPFTLTTFACFERAIRRHSVTWAIATGLGFATMSLLKYSLLGLGAYFIMVALWRLTAEKQRYKVMATSTIMALTFLSFHGAIRIWSGFELIESMKTAVIYVNHDRYYETIMAPRFSFGWWRMLNPACWFFFAAIPVSVLALWRWFRPVVDTKIIFLLLGLNTLIQSILYLGHGEGERSALYIFPFLVLPAAHAIDELGRVNQSIAPLGATVAFCALQCWLTECFLYTYW